MKPIFEEKINNQKRKTNAELRKEIDDLCSQLLKLQKAYKEKCREVEKLSPKPQKEEPFYVLPKTPSSECLNP
jgi:hypothetical protein